MLYIENMLKAIRAQDIQYGLATISSGLANLHMRKTKLIGTTAQVVSLVNPFQVLDNYDNLIVAAGELSIDDAMLEKALNELQEVEFIRMIKSGDTIKKIEVSLPELPKSYTILGERWEVNKPSEIERIAVAMLDDLSQMPLKTTDIISSYGISAKDLPILKDIGINAGFIDCYTSPVDGQEIWYSPIYWEENPANLMKLADKHDSNQVLKAIKSLRTNQGKPIDKITDPILIEAIAGGCLPSPKVNSVNGERRFLFTPLQGVQKYEKNLLEKARALVACMRYGENYGGITKIKWPVRFLESFLEKGYIRPHSEIPAQYSLAAKMLIGFAEKENGTSRYSFKLIDTIENRRAIELAIQMVTMGTVEKQLEEAVGARNMLSPGSYTNHTRSRMTLKKEAKYSLENINAINEIIRGVSSELL